DAYDLPVIISPIILLIFNDTATTEIYTLSLHDALPISRRVDSRVRWQRYTGERERREVLVRSSSDVRDRERHAATSWKAMGGARSEEHTSELQSRFDLVCRLLLEKKK